MNFTLHIWRQKNTESSGEFVTYNVKDIDSDTSFLEMLDQLNEDLIDQGEDCVVFDYDCREGICGTCSLVINGHPHGEKKATTTCQLYMRDYADQSELWIEPWRAKSFPIVKDLAVKRESFDRIIQSGGFISTSVGSAPEANSQLINKDDADCAFDSAIALVVVHVLQFVQMHLLHCLWLQKLIIFSDFHKEKLKVKSAQKE